MAEIRSGQLIAFYLFDVAQTINLQAIPGLIGGPAVAARLAPKPATPAYVQYDKPPLSFDGELVGAGEVEGFRTRFRVYDYGVMSVALSRPFAGDWSELVSAGQMPIKSDEFEQRAGGARDPRVRKLTTARVSLLRPAARRRARLDLRPASAPGVVRELGGISLRACSSSGALPVHRRQRAHRSHRERA